MAGLSLNKIFITKRREITATIKFGVITQQCKGKGICSITTDGPDFQTGLQCNTARGIVGVDSNNSLTICFEKSSMKEYILKKFFDSGIFLVMESFILPSEILNSIALDHYQINMGEYEIQETETYFKVKF